MPKTLLKLTVSNSLLYTMCAVAILLICLVSYMVYFLYTAKEVETPSVILALFDDLFTSKDFNKVAQKYFLPGSTGGYRNKSVLHMEYVLGDSIAEVSAYELSNSEDGYIEVTMYDEEGSPVYPRFGFFYKLTEDESKIDSYVMVRLQPFSRLNEEYSKEWMM